MKTAIVLALFASLSPITSFAQDVKSDLATTINQVFGSTTHIKGEVIAKDRKIKTILVRKSDAIVLNAPTYDVGNGKTRESGFHQLGIFEFGHDSYELKKSVVKTELSTLVTYTTKIQKYNQITGRDQLYRQSFAVRFDANSKIIEIGVAQGKDGKSTPELVFMKKKEWSPPQF